MKIYVSLPFINKYRWMFLVDIYEKQVRSSNCAALLVHASAEV